MSDGYTIQGRILWDGKKKRGILRLSLDYKRNTLSGTGNPEIYQLSLTTKKWSILSLISDLKRRESIPTARDLPSGFVRKCNYAIVLEKRSMGAISGVPTLEQNRL